MGKTPERDQAGQHTPGPWYVDTRSYSGQVNVRNDADIIALMVPLRAGEQVHPNAMLMAAAPELLTALQTTLDDLIECHGAHVWSEDDEGWHEAGRDPGNCGYCRTINAARRALAVVKQGN